MSSLLVTCQPPSRTNRPPRRVPLVLPRSGSCNTVFATVRGVCPALSIVHAMFNRNVTIKKRQRRRSMPISPRLNPIFFCNHHKRYYRRKGMLAERNAGVSNFSLPPTKTCAVKLKLDTPVAIFDDAYRKSGLWCKII